MRSIVYDAGALVAAERNDRRFWADHRVRLESGVAPIVPSVVVAQVSRSPRQVQLRRLLRGCDVVALDEPGAHRAGALLGRSRTSDVADAVVVAVAAHRRADVITGDRADIERLVAVSRERIGVVDI